MRVTLIITATLVALVVSGGSCGGGGSTTNVTEPETVGVPLILEGDEVGDWMTIGNTFSMRGPWQSSHEDSVFYRAGILFQFADYDTATDYQFGQIIVFSGGSPRAFKRDDLTDSTAYFFNLVADWDDHPSDPILEEEAFALYPNDNPHSCPTGCGDLDPRCLRGRKLHENMKKVLAVMTFWQGPNGWSAKSSPRNRQPTSSNQTRFSLPDQLRLEVFRSKGNRGSQIMAPVVTFEAGTVDSIRVTLQATQPQRGEMADPPWLWP